MAAGLFPGIGQGSVNGQQALYPYAGQVGQYQQAMQQLQLDPNDINLMQPGQLAAAEQAAQQRALYPQMQMQNHKAALERQQKAEEWAAKQAQLEEETR